MTGDPFELLTCPVCGAALTEAERTLCCRDGHSYDLARQGYAALLTGRPPPSADTAAMVQARVEFLRAGHYAPLAASLAAIAEARSPRTVIDVGAGTGYYLASVLDAVPGASGLGLDTSAPALRLVARAHARAKAAAWDVWRPLPLRDACTDLLLDVFAPRNGREFARVLRPGGAVVTVTPSPGHLAQLRAALPLLDVDPAKEDRLKISLEPVLQLDSTQALTIDLTLDAAEVLRIVAMSPTAHHVDVARLERAIGEMRTPVTVTAEFAIRTFVLPRDAVDY